MLMNFKLVLLSLLFVSCTNNSINDLKKRFSEPKEIVNHIQLYNNGRVVNDWCGIGDIAVTDNKMEFIDLETKHKITIVGTISAEQTEFCISKPKIKNLFMMRDSFSSKK